MAGLINWIEVQKNLLGSGCVPRQWRVRSSCIYIVYAGIRVWRLPGQIFEYVCMCFLGTRMCPVALMHIVLYVTDKRNIK